VTCTLVAASAACCASLKTAAADFAASPFDDDEEPPQPAVRPATIAKARSPIRRRLPHVNVENLPDATPFQATLPANGVASLTWKREEFTMSALQSWDLDEAVRTYERLFGGRLEHRARVDDQGVEAASIRVGDGRIELLSALGDDTPVGKFLAARGPGMHHVAYEVEDVRAAVAELAAGGAELIDTEPRQGCSGSRLRSCIRNRFTEFFSEVVSGG